MKRIFFATPGDIIPVLARFEANAPVKFVATGNLETPNRAIHPRVADLPDPGLSTDESGIFSASLMVSLRETPNHMHAFRGSRGERR